MSWEQQFILRILTEITSVHRLPPDSRKVDPVVETLHIRHKEAAALASRPAELLEIGIILERWDLPAALFRRAYRKDRTGQRAEGIPEVRGGDRGCPRRGRMALGKRRDGNCHQQ